MTKFACERSYVEAIEQPFLRNVLIVEYCSEKFSFIDLIDLYYRQLDSNIIVVILIVVFVFPCLFISISAASEKYLAASLKGLSKKLGLSPSLAATTMVAFANGAPDIFSSFAAAHRTESFTMSLASLLGAFVLTTTIVLANVLYSVPSMIVLPKLAVIKELGFYSYAILGIVVLGILKANTLSVAVFLSGSYLAYIAATAIVEHLLEKKRKGIEDMNRKDEEKGRLTHLDREQRQGMPPVTRLTDELGKKTDLNVDLDVESYAVDPSNMATINENLRLIYDEIFDPSISTFRQYNQLVLTAGGLLTIPYIYNPLMGTKARFLVIFGSILLSERVFFGSSYSWLIHLFIALGVALLCLLLEVFGFKQAVIDPVYECIAAVGAVAWIKILSVLILDFIYFLAFYFSIEEIMLATLIIAAGNSLTDFFNNTALALQGEAVMGALATYSGQTFNTLVGFTVHLLANWKRHGETRFDIFGIDSSSKHRVLGLMPPKNLVITVLLVFVCAILVISWSYYFNHSFVLKRVFGVVLLSIYFTYFLAVVVVGLVIR